MRGSHRLWASAAAALALAGTAAGGEEGRPAVLGSGRVALAPLNLGVRVVAQVAPGLAAMERAMHEVLASDSSPLIAIDAARAVRLWSEVAAPGSLEGGPLQRLETVRARFARRLSAELGFDAIVFPVLITRRARLEGHSARWDGTSRSVDVPGQEYEEIDALRSGPIRISRSGARGELAAVSVHVAVLSAAGWPRFTGTGGLVLLQEVVSAQGASGEGLVVRDRERPFDDAEALREGIRAAFR